MELNVKLIKRMQRNYECKLARYSLIFRRILRPVIEDQEARFMQKLPLITKPTYKNIMDIEQENHIVGLAMRPVYISVVTEAAEELLNEHKMFIKSVSPRMLLSQKIFDYANKYSLAMSGYINKTTSKKIKKLILRGFKDNLTYGQMAKKIKTDIFRDLSQGYRAKALARTECHGMVENGSFEAAKASKVIKEKTWSAAADARETHGEANYQTVKLTDQYVVGGYLLDYPGDTSYGAGLEEIMNCRCSSLYSSRIHKDRITTTKELLARYEKPITLPRRGHLPKDMDIDTYTRQLMADAKARGIILDYDTAGNYCNAVNSYTTTGSDQGIRIFQHGGLQGLKNAGYSPGEIKRLMKEAKNLEKFLKISAKYKEDMIFRGLKLEPEVWGRFAPGQIMDMQGVSSFSSDFLAARNKGNVVFGLMKSKTGVSVMHISGYPAEKEILFSNFAKFRITGIKSTEMGVFVSMEEITFAPKLKLIVPLTRGHLTAKALMAEEGMSGVQLFIEDSLKDGLPRYSYNEAKKIVDTVQKFTVRDYRMIRSYQKNPISFKKYYGVAEAKRVKLMVANVETFIKYTPNYPNDVIYRGIHLEADKLQAYKLGQIIDMRGTSSFSSSHQLAKDYGNVIFKVKNKTGVSIKYISTLPVEDEILISANTKFKILKIQEIGNKTYITLNEIIPKPKLFAPVWKPVMTQAEADAWAKGSKYANDIFYHGTTDKSAIAIKLDGFKIDSLGKGMGNGGVLGSGHYVSSSSSYAKHYVAGKEGELLTIKTNVKNVLDMASAEARKLTAMSEDVRTIFDMVGDVPLAQAKKNIASIFASDAKFFKIKWGRVRLSDKILSQLKEASKFINEKQWVAFKDIYATQNFTREMARREIFKIAGYDAGYEKVFKELVIFDDKSLVIIQQEAAKLPTAMKATAEQLRKSLEVYQDGAFQPINEFLRNQKIVPAQLSKLMPDIANMDSLMKASVDDYYLYRGDGAGVSVNLFPRIEGLPTKVSAEQVLYGRIDGKTYAQFLNDKLKGKIFRDTGFVSTSIDSQLVIDRFVSGSTELTEHGAVGFVEIMAPKGTKMINVENVSLMGAKESEMILSRGTAFKIEMVDIKPYPSESATIRFYIRYLVSIVKVH